MKNKIALSLQIVIGIVFLLSAYSKFIAPGIVEIILVDHGIVHTRELAAVLVRILIGFEFGIGLLFLQPYSIKKIAAPLAMLFLIGFTLYLVYTGFIQNDSQNCGCFGEMIKMSPLESIIKNIVLIAMLVFLYRLKPNTPINSFLPFEIIIVTIVVVLITLPVKDPSKFVFYKYTEFVGAGRVDLANGNKIIAVFNLECDHCQETSKEIAELQRENVNFPPVYVLFFKEAENTPQKFFEITNSQFPYAMISPQEFFDLIGQSPPRLYLLHNGQIKEYWDSDFINHIKSLKVK